ncbi:MAG: JDVT-CTERM system glutamic-type intramembrane protease [Burkholderiales bacterium]
MRAILRDLALDRCPPFFRDWQFVAAVVAGLLFWVFLAGVSTGVRRPTREVDVVLLLCLLQPLMEELIFRGVLQGELLRRSWGKRKWMGISAANAATSIAFTALHFLSHPPLWAAGVMIPSLLFGHFRERHTSLYPPICLHIYYNTGYFFTTGFPT